MRALTLAAALGLATACSSDAVDNTDVTRGRIDCDERTPALTYDNFGQGFLAKNCTGCHHSEVQGDDRKGAPDTIDLDTRDDLATWAYVAHARTVGDAATMPPGGGLSIDELTRFDEWVQCDVLEGDL